MATLRLAVWPAPSRRRTKASARRSLSTSVSRRLSSVEHLVPSWAPERLGIAPTPPPVVDGARLAGEGVSEAVVQSAFAPPLPRPSKARRLPSTPQETNVVVAGATGYVGRHVLTELSKRGYSAYALARRREGRGTQETRAFLAEAGATDTVFADIVIDQGDGEGACAAGIDGAFEELALRGVEVHAVVCCLASRTGGVRDSWEIDYAASKRLVDAARGAGAAHFTLLSAICCQRPLLEFHRAKLSLHEYLTTLDDIAWTDVRPTAYLKSLTTPVQIARLGGPFPVVGGCDAPNKAVAEAELASFIVDCMESEDKHQRICPIGGPGRALNAKQQGEVVYEALGTEPWFQTVPFGVFAFLIETFDWLDARFPGGGSGLLNGKFEDVAEFAKIGAFYASEPMLSIDPATMSYSAAATPETGATSLESWLREAATDTHASSIGSQVAQGGGLGSVANLLRWAKGDTEA